MNQPAAAAILGALVWGATYLAIVPFRAPRRVLRVLEEMPAPRLPRLRKRGAHHRPRGDTLDWGHLDHGINEMPDGYQLSAFPGEAS